MVIVDWKLNYLNLILIWNEQLGSIDIVKQVEFLKSWRRLEKKVRITISNRNRKIKII